METIDIMKKINSLSIEQRMLIAERIINSVREEEHKTSLENAANSLYKDYATDENLTIFTQLDCENFYETR
ncbi:MAG: hypothetical protein LBT27_06195 [Prevotellaceae bacterium]|jgi:hypothetical protein|nr:hypothetical protein [Prevotellaceae bacterium]